MPSYMKEKDWARLPYINMMNSHFCHCRNRQKHGSNNAELICSWHNFFFSFAGHGDTGEVCTAESVTSHVLTTALIIQRNIWIENLHSLICLLDFLNRQIKKVTDGREEENEISGPLQGNKQRGNIGEHAVTEALFITQVKSKSSFVIYGKLDNSGHVKMI